MGSSGGWGGGGMERQSQDDVSMEVRMSRNRSQTPRPGRPSRGLAPTRPDIPLPEMIRTQMVIQHTAKGVRDPRRNAFDIPLNVDLFWLHFGPPRTWTPYMASQEQTPENLR